MTWSAPCVAICCVVFSACAQPAKSEPATEERAANFELVCDATSMPEVTDLHCVRHDTRNGDVKRVAIPSLAVAQTPTAATTGPAGSYQLACRATSSNVRSDFFCFRLNTDTGELVLVPLQNVGVVPEGAPDPLIETPTPSAPTPSAPTPSAPTPSAPSPSHTH